MATHLDQDEILPILLDLRKRGGTQLELYVCWRAAISRAMAWTVTDFEQRMERAESYKR